MTDMCRGLKRGSPESCCTQLPYKLVRTNAVPGALPVVVYAPAIARPVHRNAKRQCLGQSAANLHSPCSLLTSSGSCFQAQTSSAARSLFQGPLPVRGATDYNGSWGAEGKGQQTRCDRQRVADSWHAQQMVLLQCLLQQQVANLARFSAPAEDSKVWAVCQAYPGVTVLALVITVLRAAVTSCCVELIDVLQWRCM